LPIQNERQQLWWHGWPIGYSTGRWRGIEQRRRQYPQAPHERKVLPAREHVGDWRTHPTAQSSLDIQQFCTFVSAVPNETTVGNNLEYKIARRRHRPASDAPAAR